MGITILCIYEIVTVLTGNFRVKLYEEKNVGFNPLSTKIKKEVDI